MTPFTASIWLTTAVAIAQPSASRVWQIRSDRSAQLVQTAANRDLDSSARNSALSLLATTEFDKALEIAPSLLGETGLTRDQGCPVLVHLRTSRKCLSHKGFMRVIEARLPSAT